MNEKVKLENGGRVRELEFEHALQILREQEKTKKYVFKVVGNHEFINNELIIKPNNKISTESTKQGTSTRRRKVSKSVEDSNETL